MPELPEVETIVRHLQQRLKGNIIKSVHRLSPKLRYPIPSALANLKNVIVTHIERRSKYILIHLMSKSVIVIHLGMTGRLYFCDSSRPLAKHDHLIFSLDQSTELRYQDTRRFGFCDLIHENDLPQSRYFKNLGVEPLTKDFTAQGLKDGLKAKNASIKSLLLDGKIVVGVGNIYACEALFLAQISPFRAGKSLTTRECATLVRCIQDILEASIKSGGTTFRDYVSTDEQPGLHQIQLFVYGRDGQKCKKCKNLILRQMQNQRSTFFCAQCQKAQNDNALSHENL